MISYYVFLLWILQFATAKDFIAFKKGLESPISQHSSCHASCSINGTNFVVLKNTTLKEVSQHYKDYEIEEDQEVSISLEWHVDRMDQVNLPLNNLYKGASYSASSIDVYVFDTGVDIYHPELSNNSPQWGSNFIDSVNYDCHGHGTHVASLVGGKSVGVGRNVRLISVKVLGCSGSGSYSSIIQGVEWVVNQAKKTGRISVINMSLGGGYSAALTTAIQNAFYAGVYSVVAAGNDNANACNYSPANVPEAITVGATDSQDNKAWFSNHGSCLDVYAPGACLNGAVPGNRYQSMCGTSMASPVAAGILSVYLAMLGRSGYQMFFDTMTAGIVKNNPGSTANKFVYLDVSKFQSPPPPPPPSSPPPPPPPSPPTPPPSSPTPPNDFPSITPPMPEPTPPPTSSCPTSTFVSSTTLTVTTTLLSTIFLTETSTTMTSPCTNTPTPTSQPSQPLPTQTPPPRQPSYCKSRGHFVLNEKMPFYKINDACKKIGKRPVAVNHRTLYSVRSAARSCYGDGFYWLGNWYGKNKCFSLFTTSKTSNIARRECSSLFRPVCK